MQMFVFISILTFLFFQHSRSTLEYVFCISTKSSSRSTQNDGRRHLSATDIRCIRTAFTFGYARYVCASDARIGLYAFAGDKTGHCRYVCDNDFSKSIYCYLLGFALNDSPMGLAAYILEKFSGWTNSLHIELADGGLTRSFTLDELLTNVMIYWTNGNIASSQRFYKETFADPMHDPVNKYRVFC